MKRSLYLTSGLAALVLCALLSAAAPPPDVKYVKPHKVEIIQAAPVLEFKRREIDVPRISPTVALVRKFKASVVCIWSASKDSSRGTGILVSDKGHILTARHTLGVSSDLRVRLLGYVKSFEAEIVAEQRSSDLALLKIDLPSEYHGVPVCFRGEDPEQGEDVVLIGTQLGSPWRVTKGIISQLSVQVDVDGESMRLLEADAAINSGNSGGPLFDLNGNAVGVAIAMHTHGHGNSGVYQTPDVVRHFLSRNLHKGSD